ncbi:hypothetical protein NJB95_07185 [Brucella intermedia]|uniref:hypothetical protein n=1 Tax=Brucella intermedia TaxID=94625 RepID=UPI00209A9EF9|nr:hypothetical protein [Brucella intermedia]MCO7736394.1 hypothetical protein [Brucella intermedia]WLF99068.1 hypothetical protein Q5698_15240 [Brucella intermedia]
MASEPRNYPDYVFVAYDEDFSAQTHDVAVSLDAGNLVGTPVKYVRHDLNTRPAPVDSIAPDTDGNEPTHITYNPVYMVTYEGADPTRGYVYAREDARPAPAATDTGLETVRKEYRFPMRDKWELQPKMFGMDAVEERFLVLRSQAEGLLAAEREAQQRLLDIIEEANDDKEALEADNAALTARIKELEDRLEFDPGGGDRIDALESALEFSRHGRECVEAKLAAAEKVRKAAEHVVWFDWSDNDDDAVKAVSDLRSVLEGQPYKCEWQQRAETAETKLEAAEKELERLTEFANSFHITVVDNFYKDVTLHLVAPHSLSIRIPNDSTKSFIFKDLEERRRAVLGGKSS